MESKNSRRPRSSWWPLTSAKRTFGRNGLTAEHEWKPALPPSGDMCGAEAGNGAATSALPAARAQRSANPTVSIVIPARNEARNLEVVLPELPSVAQVVLVDGQSVDGTSEAARRLYPGIIVVQQTRTGKGNAMVCGFEAATADIIVMFDADGSADPEEIPRFVSTLVAGADFAKGSRFLQNGGSDDITALRKTGNWFLNKLANIAFRTSFTDLCYGYNAFWRDIVPVLELPVTENATTPPRVQWGDGFEIETLLSCRVAATGLTVVEVPSLERLRIFGTTNLRTFVDGARVLRTILAEWRRSVRRRRSAHSAGRSRPADPHRVGAAGGTWWDRLALFAPFGGLGRPRGDLMDSGLPERTGMPADQTVRSGE